MDAFALASPRLATPRHALDAFRRLSCKHAQLLAPRCFSAEPRLEARLKARLAKPFKTLIHTNMPRPRGADAAGLLLRELELHPPAEEWHRRNMYGGPWSDPDDMGLQDDTPKLCNSSDPIDSGSLESCDVYYGAHGLWPRKRRMSERDAAFGLNTSVGLGAYLGIMGSRRDVVTAVWKTGLEGVWYKCIRCLRQTSAFASPGAASPPNQNGREAWWISRWAYCCPMCGGTWVRVV